MSHFKQPLETIEPDWPAPANVQALVTTRFGGVSSGPYATMNLGDHVGDDVQSVATNRKRLQDRMPAEPCWLKQVHGVEVVKASQHGASADASYTDEALEVSCIMTADCLPVLFCNGQGTGQSTVVAAAHAGWRGLLDGVIEATAAKFPDPNDVMVWLGPAIGPDAFEVGAEVRQAFIAQHTDNHQAFKASPFEQGKYFADLYLLAKMRLQRLGISKVYGGEYCTLNDKCENGEYRFFSYRRDGQTGRMASCVWFE